MAGSTFISPWSWFLMSHLKSNGTREMFLIW